MLGCDGRRNLLSNTTLLIVSIFADCCFSAKKKISFYFHSFGVMILSTNIYVGNLSWTTTDADLQSLFSQYGQVTSAHVIEDRETGRSRGFGFVEMDSEGARKSIQALNGTDCQGRALKVNEAQPRQSRPRY